MDYANARVWERAMQLATGVLIASKALPKEERYGIRLQMTRSATSIPSNIAEGWVRESVREKVQFLAIAHGSLAELHTQLLLCRRANWLSEADVAKPLALADHVGRMLTMLKRHWRQTPPRR